MQDVFFYNFTMLQLFLACTVVNTQILDHKYSIHFTTPSISVLDTILAPGCDPGCIKSKLNILRMIPDRFSKSHKFWRAWTTMYSNGSRSASWHLNVLLNSAIKTWSAMQWFSCTDYPLNVTGGKKICFQVSFYLWVEILYLMLLVWELRNFICKLLQF